MKCTSASWRKADIQMMQNSTLFKAAIGQLRTVKKIKYKPPNGA
jgi:hypothetical protein